MQEMKRWESGEGVRFLQRVGLREGMTVVDFGARVGHYALPAARAVGRDGRVYAVDKDAEALRHLTRKARRSGLPNIVCMHTSGDTRLDLDAGSVDAVLCYDVLHILPEPDRARLYAEIVRLLKTNGCFSVYPKHLEGDSPANHFRDLTPNALLAEIEAAGLRFLGTTCGRLSHDKSLTRGCVLNFKTDSRIDTGKTQG
ncbi:MAG: class I SAM-dependent methyltransferase [Kiritimatiellae bacterium]|nr:class I SAM-dependent methyltransferase [Kiritimatiellia bacterium]